MDGFVPMGPLRWQPAGTTRTARSLRLSLKIEALKADVLRSSTLPRSQSYLNLRSSLTIKLQGIQRGTMRQYSALHLLMIPLSIYHSKPVGTSRIACSLWQNLMIEAIKADILQSPTRRLFEQSGRMQWRINPIQLILQQKVTQGAAWERSVLIYPEVYSIAKSKPNSIENSMANSMANSLI